VVPVASLGSPRSGEQAGSGSVFSHADMAFDPRPESHALTIKGDLFLAPGEAEAASLARGTPGVAGRMVAHEDGR
jgi:hypothetical protein